MMVVTAGLRGGRVITQNIQHRGNRGTPVTSSVKREVPDLAAPRAIGENAEMVITSVRHPGRGQPNGLSPNQRYRTHYGERSLLNCA